MQNDPVSNTELKVLLKPKPFSLVNEEVKFATFNLFNYLEPPNACYEFERIYSAEQWDKKQRWITDYLVEFQPDVIGFQEVFSTESLKELVAKSGYPFFSVVDEPEVLDDFIYSKPVVAIASKFPIVDVAAVECDHGLVDSMGLSKDFSFSRQVIRATVELPHIGQCDCYVVHFKSKRSSLDAKNDQLLSDQDNVISQFKAEIAGSWASSIQRGSEAALLLVNMIERRQKTGFPMILMGDFNTVLSDGVLNHLLISSLRSPYSKELLKMFSLRDSWDLYAKGQQQNNEEALIRTPTHYYGGQGNVLDYILMSCEFDSCFHASLFEVANFQVYDRHLINPIFDRDGESTDHGIVLVSLLLRQ